LAFLRVVEVFPPVFPAAVERGHDRELEETVDAYLREVRAIRGFADVVLVASLKRPDISSLPPTDTGILLRKRLGLDAAPVLVVRDQDRLQLLSSVVGVLVGGLRSMMLAWGDADLPRRSPKLMGFSGLGEALAEASQIREGARFRCRFFAPVDLRRLFTTGGVALAKERLAAGSDYLLAQPPTTDAADTFESHARLIRKAGLEGKVILNVFPFRGPQDVKECEKYFGWQLPKSLHENAVEGESYLLGVEKEVVRRMRSEHFPGVYLSTRGTPALARDLLS
jgi:hypothetical protein